MNIEADTNFKHHDTLFECITRWKNKTEVEGHNAKYEVLRTLAEISKKHGRFSSDDVAFLTDVTGIPISEQSKEPTYSNESPKV